MRMFAALLIALGLFAFSAFGDQCDTTLDHIYAENQMVAELITTYRMTFDEVKDIQVKGILFKAIPTGVLPSQGCAFRYEWTAKVEFRGPATQHCIVRHPIKKSLVTYPDKAPVTTFTWDIKDLEYDCP